MFASELPALCEGVEENCVTIFGPESRWISGTRKKLSARLSGLITPRK